MTIPGKSIDGWPIHKDYQSKNTIYDERPSPQGLDLFQQIIWGLEGRGIVLTDERAEKIKKACQE